MPYIDNILLANMPRRGYLFVENNNKKNFALEGLPLNRYNPYFYTMPDTYTQLYIHFVFAVKYREATIKPEWEERLHKYITGIIQNNVHKLIAINSATDHIHILVGLNPKQSISDLMRLVKGDSSEFINKENLAKRKFLWQEGYGAFSNSRSQIDGVVKYILNQKKHHLKKNFRDEYLEILKDYGVEYDEKYVFQELLD